MQKRVEQKKKRIETEGGVTSEGSRVISGGIKGQDTQDEKEAEKGRH